MDEQLEKLPDLESKVEGITKEANISVTEKCSVLENKVDEIAKDTENNVAGNKSVTDLADRLTRANNVIIHKMTEDTNKSKAEKQRDDLDRILQLCQLVTEQPYDTNDITIKRIGKKPEKDAGTDKTATRPTLVTSTYPHKKALLMKNLHKPRNPSLT